MRRGDKWIATGWALLGATLTVGTAAVITTAQAQDPGQPPPPGQGQPGGGFGPGGGGGFGGGMRFGGGGAPVITATDRFVYVLRGNTLYQFDASNLRLLNQAELPAMAGRGGGGFGQGGDGAGGAGTRRRNRTGGDTAPPQQ